MQVSGKLGLLSQISDTINLIGYIKNNF